jgi:hypothetical protein
MSALGQKRTLVTSLDHLVGGCEQGRRHCDAERLGSLEAAASLIGRTAAIAATTAGSASCWSCRGVTCGSANPVGTSNVSLSCAREKNSDAVKAPSLCAAGINSRFSIQAFSLARQITTINSGVSLSALCEHCIK